MGARALRLRLAQASARRGSELSREQAKALVSDWVELKRSPTASAGSWRSSAAGSSPGFRTRCSFSTAASREAYEKFLQPLTSQLRYLSASYRDAPDGVPRLVALMALIYAGLCIAEQQAVVDRYARPFCRELDRQILPDGGHISRNPDALVDLLLDLLPLRQCFVARDRSPPKN